MTKIAAILILWLLVISCATSYRPMYMYNEVRVDNATSRVITDVSVRIGDSGSSISCDRIGANEVCSRRFGKLRYPYQSIEMSWTAEDGIRQIREFEPRIPGYFLTPFPLRILLDLERDGEVVVRFWQDEPLRTSDDD
ncbi:MAG: hypothetical protein OEO19_05860 [Gammaproteobacteria bacterium]|nr:hypothetical protein [Gammaproteobacteria bacterium]MDH3447317.1 hypothetical protein [Gammaproteobacteria bacterium]